MTNDRKVVMKALVGSHNYNLNDKTSDKDYKLFVLPTFDDLYEGKMYSKSVIGEAEDYDIHDIRSMGNLLWKANLNYIEPLFSREIKLDDELHFLTYYRELIARMNLPTLYKACIGTHLTKMKLLSKGTSGTKHLVDKFGYDTKQAMHAYRVLDFLERYVASGFTSFEKAIRYNEEEGKELLAIKEGKYSEEDIRKILTYQLEDVRSIENHYINQEPNIELKNQIDLIIKEVVRKGLM